MCLSTLVRWNQIYNPRVKPLSDGPKCRIENSWCNTGTCVMNRETGIEGMDILLLLLQGSWVVSYFRIKHESLVTHLITHLYVCLVILLSTKINCPIVKEILMTSFDNMCTLWCQKFSSLKSLFCISFRLT